MYLTGKNIMILAASGVEESELIAAQRELMKSGATVHTISSEAGLINCWNKVSWGLNLPIDGHVSTKLAADYDMLVVPGGKRSAQKLSVNPHCERIVDGFFAAKKPIAFMGEAVELLALLNMAKDRTVGGPQGCKMTLESAGAIWSDEACVYDGSVMTGDVGEDSVAFVTKIVQHFSNDGTELKAAA